MDSHVIYKYKLVTEITTPNGAMELMQWCRQYEKDNPELNLLWIPYWSHLNDFENKFVIEMNDLNMFTIAKLIWAGLNG